MLRPSGVSSAKRGELRRLRELALGDPARRQERGRLAVAERDRAGLVEEEHVHVARRLDRPARGRDHVRLDHAVHAGDADRGEQPADGRRDEAHEQRDEDGEPDGRAPCPRRRTA